jgi:hypothetical protein
VVERVRHLGKEYIVETAPLKRAKHPQQLRPEFLWLDDAGESQRSASEFVRDHAPMAALPSPRFALTQDSFRLTAGGLFWRVAKMTPGAAASLGGAAGF